MKTIRNIYQHYEICRSTNSNSLIWVLLRIYYFLFYGLNINSHHKVTIKGLKNISINKSLRIGMNPEGFVSRNEKTYLNIQGKLKIKDSWSIGRGCRIYIAKDGVMEIGKGGYVNSFTNFMIGDRLKIGDNCIISWNCQFLNEDTHEIHYEGKKSKNREILIGNNVWIGNNVSIYAGTVIADNCVVASDTVVKSSYNQSHLLIGGIPSKILKENVTWNI